MLIAPLYLKGCTVYVQLEWCYSVSGYVILSSLCIVRLWDVFGLNVKFEDKFNPKGVECGEFGCVIP